MTNASASSSVAVRAEIFTAPPYRRQYSNLLQMALLSDRTFVNNELGEIHARSTFAPCRAADGHRPGSDHGSVLRFTRLGGNEHRPLVVEQLRGFERVRKPRPA